MTHRSIKTLYEHWINGPQVEWPLNAQIEYNAEYPRDSILHTMMYIALSDPKNWHTPEVLKKCANAALQSHEGGVDALIRSVKENIRTQLESLQPLSLQAFTQYAPKVLNACAKMAETLHSVLRIYYEVSPTLVEQNVEHDTTWMYKNFMGMKTTLHDDDTLLDVLRKESSVHDRAMDPIDQYIQQLFQRNMHGFIEHLMIKNEDFRSHPWRNIFDHSQAVQKAVLQCSEGSTLQKMINHERFNKEMSAQDGENIKTLFAQKTSLEWFNAFVHAKKDVEPFPIDHPLQPLNPWILLALSKKGVEHLSELNGIHPLQKESHQIAVACIRQIYIVMKQVDVLTPEQSQLLEKNYDQLIRQKWSVDQFVASTLDNETRIQWNIPSDTLRNDPGPEHG